MIHKIIDPLLDNILGVNVHYFFEVLQVFARQRTAAFYFADANFDYFPFDHGFLGRAATRIINEVKGINRVVYDITSKPPGTIEWE